MPAPRKRTLSANAGNANATERGNDTLLTSTMRPAEFRLKTATGDEHQNVAAPSSGMDQKLDAVFAASNTMDIARKEPGQDEIMIFRVPDLCRSLRVSRTTLYRWVRSGQFPSPVKLGPKVIGWPCGTVIAWLASRPSAD